MEYDLLISEYRHFITEFKLIESYYISRSLEKFKFKYVSLEHTRKLVL